MKIQITLAIFVLSLSMFQISSAAGPSGVSTIPLDQIEESFSLILASDTQFPWMAKDAHAGIDRETVLESGIATNRMHVSTMNRISEAKLSEPLAVIINGDLTAFSHSWQWELFKQFYYTDDPDPDEVSLDYPIFPGLGNHDYANNINDCWGGPSNWLRFYGSNGCARNALDYISEFVKANPNVISRYDEDSAAYSWDMGHYHFVQLQNYPTYERDEIEVKSSIEWLKKDLEIAQKAGKRIVLNFHDFGEHMRQGNKAFREAIKDYDVVAIFVGHIHSSVGQIKVRPALYANNKPVPVFRCGSASWNHFLHVSFHKDHIVVSVVDSKTGAPQIRSQTKY